MKNIAVIPARGGSKRLPGKNLLDLGGLPLIAHSIAFAKANLDLVSDVFVSTDDPRIARSALKFGAKVVHRPEAISGDFEPTSSALQHVLSEIGTSVDNVILLQPTNPLRPATLLADAYAEFVGSARNSLFTVSRNEQKFGRVKNGVFTPYNYTPGQRSQDLEPLFFENGLLYISRADSILEGKIITDDAFPFIVDHPFASVDIDTQHDLDYARYLYSKYSQI